MHIETKATLVDRRETNVRLDQSPDTCPRCHRSIHPNFISAHARSDGGACQAIFRCAHLKCQEVFIGSYTYDGGDSSRMHFKLRGVAPKSSSKSNFPETIEEVSPSFCEIFGQTEEADTQELDQLVGIGLRKALEFLVKDYAASEHPDRESEIRAAPLAACITNFVNDANVKECAKRAAWLGNDETHYTRKWETRDVNDLRLLVRLTVNWIENALLTKKYIAEM